MPALNRTGGELLIDALLLHGAELAFCVPGESFLGALDAMHSRRDRFRIISCRHEAGAVNMAEAAGKLTGRPGIAFVTRGPGATQGSVGIHTAAQDSTPLILFVGQVKRAHVGREAFQEMDFKAFFGSLAKDVIEVRAADDIPDAVADAFALSIAGRMGPVVVVLPEDVQTERSTARDSLPDPLAHLHPTALDLDRLRTALLSARRPLMIVGGSGWTSSARDQITLLAENFDLPVATAWRCKDRFDNTHACYIGDVGLAIDPNLARIVRESDLILAVGTRLDDNTTSGYTLLTPPHPEQKLIHVYPDILEFGRVYVPWLGIESAPAQFAAAAAVLEPADIIVPWAEWRAEARADYEAFTMPRPCPGSVNLARIMSELPQMLPADTIVTNGGGTYTAWHHRYYLHRRYGTYLGPTSGAMGYGVPAAIAAKALAPRRTVVALAGDGCFMMAAAEMATAFQYKLPIVVIVINNGLYGSIRMHQERRYPGRAIATSLTNPDFAALARSFGCHGETVATTDAFGPALRRCLATTVPSLIELQLDPDAIMPHTTLSEIAKSE